MIFHKWAIGQLLVVWQYVKLPAPFKKSLQQEFIQQRRTSLRKLIIGLLLAALFGIGLQLFFHQITTPLDMASKIQARLVGVLIAWLALTAGICDWQQNKAEDRQENL